MSNNKIVPYSLCTRLLPVVLCLQFAVSFCIKNMGGLPDFGLPSDYVYILLSQAVAVALPCFLLCAFKKAGFKRTFRINGIRGYSVLRCAALGFCLQPAAIMINAPLQRLAPVSNAIVSPPDGWYDILLMILFICIIPAITEELMLRGMILTSVRKKGFAFSVAVTSVMFTILHCDIYSAPGHLILGIAAAYAVLNNNSVLSGMAVHFSFNFCGVLIDYITNRYYLWGGFVGTFEFFMFLAIAGAVISTALFIRINNKKVKKYPSRDMGQNLFRAFFNVPVVITILLYVLYNLM